jgi:hypothetical protein
VSGATDDRAALGADEIRHGDADRPAELARLGHDLIGGVLALGSADLGNGLHLLDGLEELHADGDRAEAQVLVEAVDDGVPVVRIGGHGVSSNEPFIPLPSGERVG